MKLLAKDILFSLIMGLILPGVLLHFGAVLLAQRVGSSEPPAETEVTESTPLDMRLRQEDESVAWMDMDTYLVGVVLAEMPVWFEEEALKAQSVVARTYARKAWETGGKHGDGSVCTAPSCCQGYTRTEDYLAAGGTAENVEKIRNAVLATSGQVLCYDGSLIEATYFSCSGGSTEDAAAVWGADFPYLQAVDSPGEEEAAYYRDSIAFTSGELEERLGIMLRGSPSDWTEGIVYTEGGGVETIRIGGETFSGTQLRSLLGLRSTAFTIETEADGLLFTTRGYGHRVGMSQYGADAMAAQGSTYEEILSHYYQGTELMCLGTG